jgi:hypothetical protein
MTRHRDYRGGTKQAQGLKKKNALVAFLHRVRTLWI